MQQQKLEILAKGFKMAVGLSWLLSMLLVVERGDLIEATPVLIKTFTFG